MPTWSSGASLRGSPGAQLRTGTGAPSASNPSVQNDGDFFLDSVGLALYGPRANGTWPSSNYALKGAAGQQHQ